MDDYFGGVYTRLHIHVGLVKRGEYSQKFKSQHAAGRARKRGRARGRTQGCISMW